MNNVDIALHIYANDVMEKCFSLMYYVIIDNVISLPF